MVSIFTPIQGIKQKKVLTNKKFIIIIKVRWVATKKYCSNKTTKHTYLIYLATIFKNVKSDNEIKEKIKKEERITFPLKVKLDLF